MSYGVSYGGFNLRLLGFSQILSTPSGKTVHHTPQNVWRCENVIDVLCYLLSLMGLRFCTLRRRPKMLSFFVCLFVCHAYDVTSAGRDENGKMDVWCEATR